MNSRTLLDQSSIETAVEKPYLKHQIERRATKTSLSPGKLRLEKLRNEITGVKANKNIKPLFTDNRQISDSS